MGLFLQVCIPGTLSGFSVLGCGARSVGGEVVDGFFEGRSREALAWSHTFHAQVR